MRWEQGTMEKLFPLALETKGHAWGCHQLDQVNQDEGYVSLPPMVNISSIAIWKVQDIHGKKTILKKSKCKPALAGL